MARRQYNSWKIYSKLYRVHHVHSYKKFLKCVVNKAHRCVTFILVIDTCTIMQRNVLEQQKYAFNRKTILGVTMHTWGKQNKQKMNIFSLLNDLHVIMRILLLISDRKNYRYNHLEFNVTLETSLVQYQQHNIFKRLIVKKHLNIGKCFGKILTLFKV